MNRRDFLATGMVAASGIAGAATREERAMAQTGTEPRITGSFFDLIHVNAWDAAYWTDRCRFWKEANWRALIRDMHGIGIDTIICVSTAFWGRPMFPGYEKTVGIPIEFGCKDPLEVCVDEADRLGMKVFLGMGLRGRVSQVRDYTRMEPPWPEVWFTWNTAMAEALVDKFGKRACFGGLYISYEIDFAAHQVDLYEKFVKEYLRPAVGDVPLLASPGSLGEHPDLSQLPKQIERTGVTILAPQDYGGRRRDVGEALDLVRGNARGLAEIGDTLRDMGVSVWCNCEVFNLDPDPAGRASCVPGPFGRIEQQMAIQAPLADKLICYQYQGIMNRKTHLVDIGHPDTGKLYDDYVAYLRRTFPDSAGSNTTGDPA